MHRNALILTAAAALSACGDFEAPDGTIEGKVRFVAKTADMVGGVVNGRNDVRAIEADGRVLVIKLNIEENVEGPVTEQDVLAAMQPEVCKNDTFTGLLKEGAAIRIVLYTPNGKSLPPATLTQCPGSGTT